MTIEKRKHENLEGKNFLLRKNELYSRDLIFRKDAK